MDWQRVQHCADVYWPFYRLSRWFDRTAARSPDCRSGIYIDLCVTPRCPQLQFAGGSTRSGRTHFRYILSSYTHFCTAEYTSSVPSLHIGAVCQLRRWSREFRPFTLRMVQRSSFLALDVLEPGTTNTSDDDLHLLRDSRPCF